MTPEKLTPERPNTKVHARVQVTVDIPVGSTWGPTVNADQVREQATVDALNALRRGLCINGLVVGNDQPHTTAGIVGAPKVTMILLEDE